jgi:hypothetical protein
MDRIVPENRRPVRPQVAAGRRQTHVTIRPNWSGVAWSLIIGFFAGIVFATSIIAYVLA